MDENIEDEIDYERLSHDELLKRADWDLPAAEAFWYRYHYDADPVISAEVRRVLKSIAEDWDATSFWPDWYVALRDSDDPKERAEAPKWKRKILEYGGTDDEFLKLYGIKED